MTVEYSSMEVVRELKRIQSESAKGVQALYEAEVALAEAELEAEKTLQMAYIRASGTQGDRTAVSRLEASEARFQVDLRKAELNRIKTKLKQLELAQMATQTIGRQIELEARLVN